MFRPRATTFEVEVVEDLAAEVQTTLKLGSDDEQVTCVVSLREFIVTGTKDRKVRVYDRDTLGAVRAVFTQHKESLYCLARLEDDLVLSVDVNGQMFTWRPTTTQTVGSWKHDEGPINTVARLDDKQLVVGTERGDLAVLSHNSGANLKQEKRFKRKHSSWISSVFVSADDIVSCSVDKTAKVWSKSTLNHRATLRAKEHVNDVAVSDAYIVMVCWDGRILVYRNAPRYALDFILEAPDDFISVICLNSDIIAIAGGSGCVSFLSLSGKCFIARVKVSSHRLFSLAVLSDRRMAAVGLEGVCTLFCPPHQVHHAVDDYIMDVYGIDVADFVTVQPILNAWNSVQDESLSVIEACETVINSDNTTRSLDEWCVAHDLLMQAVYTGVIPGSRDYNGTVRYWHLELYQHCDKLAIGEKDIGFLVSLFDEAEHAGVIAEGSSENFITAVGIRKDIDKDKWHSANAIYQLFLRQAKTDATLKRVLHYQNVQQLVSVVNAVLGVVPIGGSIAANVISGGAAVLNDFQVCGLVESLMGVGKDMSGGFGSDKLLNLFVSRGNEVLSEDHWDVWGEDNRQAVAEAARNLGLTVGELRDKLLSAAEMKDDEQVSEREENAAVFLEEAEAKEANNHAEGETSVPDNRQPPILNAEVREVTVNVEDSRKELASWANEPLNRTSIEKLQDEEAASCLAAFLVKYNERHITNFISLKDALSNAFSAQFIEGSSFVHGDESEREDLFKATMSAIEVVVKGNAKRFLGIRLKLFMQNVLES